MIFCAVMDLGFLVKTKSKQTNKQANKQTYTPPSHENPSLCVTAHLVAESSELDITIVIYSLFSECHWQEMPLYCVKRRTVK